MSYYSGKVVWVTGASSGIGEQLVYALSKQGAHLVISSRRESELERVKKNCVKSDDVDVCVFDQSDEKGIRNAVQQVISKHGRIDVLFNNGGISQRAEALKTPIENVRRLFEVNFFGNILLGQLVAEQMVKQQSGHIAVTSSLAGKWGFFLRSAYAATKHALHGYYESLRFEVEHANVFVTLVTPGFIATEISKNALDENGKPTGQMDDNQSKGLSAEVCAARYLAGVAKQKLEFGIGGKEMLGLYLRRFVPSMFHRILRKQPSR